MSINPSDSAGTNFPTVREFIEAVGRQRFEAELGHGKQVVSRAIANNVMPAHWYFDIRDFCAELSIVVPDHLFRGGRGLRTDSGKQCDDRRPVNQPDPSANPTTSGDAA